MGFFSNKKGIKQAKAVAGTMRYGAATTLEAADANSARNIAAEEAKTEVFSRLGKEGTYGPDAEGSSSGLLPDSYYDTTGTGLSERNQDLRPHMAGVKDRDEWLATPREGIIDPEAYADKISQSASFRTQSKQVAESEQLLNQEGPAWDELRNSTTGAINDQSALLLRDTLRQLRNDAAKGGSARRTALNEFNVILAQERAQRVRVENTWKSNLALFDVVRKNADRVQAGTRNFMASLPEVNDAFRNAMNNAAQMQMHAGQVLANVAQNAYAVRQSQQPVDFWNNLAEGAVSAVVSMIPYVGQAASAAIKTAGAGGGYQGFSSYTDAEGNQHTSAPGAGAGSGTGAGGALISGIGESGGGDGQLTTGQVSEGYNAARGAAGTAWSTVSGTVSGWGWSDVRMKENLEHVGSQNGHKIYEFNFRGDTRRFRGALAQEVIKTNPEAVMNYEGYLMLNYDALGIEMKAI